MNGTGHSSSSMDEPGVGESLLHKPIACFLPVF